MLWLVWFVWFVYCLGVAPTWCFVYDALRPQRGRGAAWLVAAGAGMLWPVFHLQHHLWHRRRWDEFEADLRQFTESASH